jgi:homocysteine S-methyltransferase
VQGDLLAAHALDVRNIFVVMGDPTSIGEYPEALDKYDVVPTGLIKLVKQGFNQGLDYAGELITQPTNFLVGCALNPTPLDLAREIKVLRQKIENGADFALTQPLYDLAQVEAMFAEAERRFGPGGFPVPLLLGVLPLQSSRHAEFLHNEVPGITIPAAVRERLRAAGDRGADVGLEMTLALLDEVGRRVAGTYIMPSFGRYEGAAELVRRLRTRTGVPA